MSEYVCMWIVNKEESITDIMQINMYNQVDTCNRDVVFKL